MENQVWNIIKTDNFIRYSLANEKYFSEIEYRYITNEENTHFLRCSKVTCNGNLQMVYNIQDRLELQKVLLELSTRKFYLMLKDIIQTFHKVKENNYLDCNHLVLDGTSVFLSMDYDNVALIYLPIIFENENSIEPVDFKFRRFLTAIVDEYKHEDDEGVKTLLEDLLEHTIVIDEILNKITDGTYELIAEEKRQKDEEMQKIRNAAKRKIKLVMQDTGSYVSIPITKDEFVIGKKSSVVDGAIHQPTVSRVHCKILTQDRKYSIIDLGSANGTFVNQVKCCPDVPARIRDGDLITIADLNFILVEEIEEIQQI